MLSIMEEISETAVRGSDPEPRNAPGRSSGTETRTAVGAEVPVPADDGWSEEESRRINGMEDNARLARLPSSGEERDRQASHSRTQAS